MGSEANVSCRACSSTAKAIFTGSLLKQAVTYFECPKCGYVQTEAPTWLDRAYAEAINDSDTGVMARNLANARIALATLLVLGKLNGILVDCAGGYGILVRLLRDYGVDALWADRYCQNLLARGFEHSDEPADLVTVFEAFEHFVNPAEELDGLLEIGQNILLSTQIIADPTPRQDDWWYYGKGHGQHVGFFRIRTLERLAKERGKVLVSDGINYHLIADKPINQRIWLLMIRANKLMPLLVKRRLSPKTWTDHMYIEQAER